MSSPETDQPVTQLLRRVSAGDDRALERLFPLVYTELHRRASAQMRRERPGHTLQPTALVHEAFLKMVGSTPTVSDRAHFAAIASRVMRQLLVDHARRKRADKRGGGRMPTTLGTGEAAMEIALDEIIDLDRALDTLEERQRRVVEMRFFAGLEEVEIATLLGVTERTVRRDWVKARAWLYAELYPDAGEHPDRETGS